MFKILPKQNSRFCPRLLFTMVVLAFPVLTHAAANGQTKIKVDFASPTDHSCDSSYGVVYSVGGMYDVVVTLLPDGKRMGDVEYTGVSDWSWPEGLVIKACQLTDTAEPLQPSSTLLDRLQLEYYVTDIQARHDSLWRATGQPPPRVFSAPQYHFAFSVPPELAGMYLCFSAEWNHPQYGLLASTKPAFAKITTPCSETAQNLVNTSWVLTAMQQRKNDLAVALADSFVLLGWHESWGLNFAGTAARRAEHWEEAIRFLDLNFEWNHTLIQTEGWTPEYQASKADSDRYEMNRTRLMELKEQQQQQNEQQPPAEQGH